MSSRRALALATVAAALGGSTGVATAAVPPEKLHLMPLPQAAFGAQAKSLRLDRDESGIVDNARSAADTSDPNDTAASMRAAGRLTGFSVSYADLRVLKTPGRLVYVSSSVDLYRDEQTARTGLHRSLRDAVADDPRVGFKVLSSERFVAPALGDDAAGVRVKAKFGAVSLWLTGVEVRRGELLESVGVMRTDPRPANETAIALAQALTVRVEGVLAGKVTAPAAELPLTGGEAKRLAQPAIPIAGAALTSADLEGAPVTRQEYVPDQTAVEAYQREFGGAKVGRSQLMTVQNNVSLLSSEDRAQAMLAAVQRVLDPRGTSLERLLRRQFAHANGVKLDSVEVVRQGPLRLSGGASGYQVVARLTTAFGRFEAAWIFVTSGRLYGSLYVTSSPGGSLAADDVSRMTEMLADRMLRTGLHVTPVA